MWGDCGKESLIFGGKRCWAKNPATNITNIHKNGWEVLGLSMFLGHESSPITWNESFIAHKTIGILEFLDMKTRLVRDKRDARASRENFF